MKAQSFFLYETVADQINYVDFFVEFDMPDTFNSWFLVTELHVWMLLTRAMAEGSEKSEDGRFIRNNIVEAMWADVNMRARKLGAANPGGVRKQVADMSEEFQAALIAYDEGLMTDDKTLANALWRRFFEKTCEDYDRLELLVKYVRMHIRHLDSLPRRDFLKERKVNWMPIEKCKLAN
jgi:cytochrome b pre-mRNA-processing protein 3